MIELLIAILATFRITRFFTFDDGPWDLFKRLREKAGIKVVEGPPPIKIVENRFCAKLLDCPWCTAVWVAGLVTLLLSLDLVIIDYSIFALAVAGGASILDATLRALGE